MQLLSGLMFCVRYKELHVLSSLEWLASCNTIGNDIVENKMITLARAMRLSVDELTTTMEFLQRDVLDVLMQANADLRRIAMVRRRCYNVLNSVELAPCHPYELSRKWLLTVRSVRDDNTRRRLLSYEEAVAELAETLNNADVLTLTVCCNYMDTSFNCGYRQMPLDNAFFNALAAVAPTMRLHCFELRDVRIPESVEKKTFQAPLLAMGYIGEIHVERVEQCELFGDEFDDYLLRHIARRGLSSLRLSPLPYENRQYEVTESGILEFCFGSRICCTTKSRSLVLHSHRISERIVPRMIGRSRNTNVAGDISVDLHNMVVSDASLRACYKERNDGYFVIDQGHQRGVRFLVVFDPEQGCLRIRRGRKNRGKEVFNYT